MVTSMIIIKFLKKWIKIRSIKQGHLNMSNCCTIFSEIWVSLFSHSDFWAKCIKKSSSSNRTIRALWMRKMLYRTRKIHLQSFFELWRHTFYFSRYKALFEEFVHEKSSFIIIANILMHIKYENLIWKSSREFYYIF